MENITLATDERPSPSHPCFITIEPEPELGGSCSNRSTNSSWKYNKEASAVDLNTIVSVFGQAGEEEQLERTI